MAFNKYKDYDHHVKVYLFGESSVGKTCLMRRLGTDKFIPEFQKTKSLEYRCKILIMNEKRIRVEFWDSPGIRRYREEALKDHLPKVECALVVYDITDANSLTSAAELIQRIKSINDSQILLIGNKLDLDSERAVPREKAESLAESHGIRHFETSAKDGRSFSDIVTYVVKNVLLHRAECAKAMLSATEPIALPLADGMKCTIS